MCPAAASPPLASRLKDRERQPKYFFTPAMDDEIRDAYHLYVVRLDLEALRAGRSEIFRALRAENIGVNVHYVPVHLHPYYRQTQGTHPGMCPVAECAYEGLLSLPMFPAMSDSDVDDVIEAVEKVVVFYRR